MVWEAAIRAITANPKKVILQKGMVSHASIWKILDRNVGKKGERKPLNFISAREKAWRAAHLMMI